MDWNKYGPKGFQFVPLFMGPTWDDRLVRRQKETLLIVETFTFAYNITEDGNKQGEQNPFYGKFHTPETKKRIGDALRGKPNLLLGKAIVIEGTRYPSLAEASRLTGHARKTIRHRLEDPRWSDWFEIIDPTSANGYKFNF
jgi:hypothetical protein